jgi:hypothetical protein
MHRRTVAEFPSTSKSQLTPSMSGEGIGAARVMAAAAKAMMKCMNCMIFGKVGNKFRKFFYGFRY